MGHLQRGYIYEASGWFYVRHYVSVIVNGESNRMQRSHRLVAKGGKYYSCDCKAVKLMRDELMLKVNQQQFNHSQTSQREDMRIVDFWDTLYLPYCDETVKLTGESRKKPSTVRGYKQIWKQHLKSHFANRTLREYEPYMGNRFLRSLASTQGKTTLKHIKALGTAIFSHAIEEEFLTLSPWREVKIPRDAIEPERTQHYTIEEAEDLISTLVDHVDCQLIIALSCFLGLRPGEIAALRWEDFDSDCVHIRRSVVRGVVGVPKTAESTADLPMVEPRILIPLELWRRRSGNRIEGWIFESRNGTPTDLHNMIARVIVPHIEGTARCVSCKLTPQASRVTWKGLYAGRRGAATAAVEATGGNYAVAQALLRHKSMKTTLDVYKKHITPEAFRTGMKLLAASTVSFKTLP